MGSLLQLLGPGRRRPAPITTKSAWLYVDTIAKNGGYKAHVEKNRRILTGLIKKALTSDDTVSDVVCFWRGTKMLPKARTSRFRPDVPSDVASHVLSFWTPPGGY